MARLNELIGSVKPDDLIVDSNPSTDVITITLAAEVGEVKRGTVVTGTPGGKDFAPLAAAAESEKALYIVADNVNTKAEEAEGAETPARVYRMGHFAREKVNEATGYTLSAADEEQLRKSGIFLSTLLDY